MMSDAICRMPSTWVAETHAQAGGPTWLCTTSPGAAHGWARAIRSITFGDADTGDPGWPRFDLGHPRTRILDTPTRVTADPLADSRRIWEHVSGR